ncbi:MAG: hypothetical protein JRE65_17560 [Deltaproteobacteria bacterium]|nr:hypothetical protein [Deltaproteobacteria bacterium]
MSKNYVVMSTFEELKINAIEVFGNFGAWIFDEWKKLNDSFFYGENRAGEIIWGSTPQDRSLGYYSPDENLIVLHKTLMRPVYPTTDFMWEPRLLNKRKVRDVLLHEMIHQRVHQTGGWVGESSHNNKRFIEEVIRIAKLLDIDIKPKVIQKKPPCAEYGSINPKALLNFPYSSRPQNYYYEES